PDTVSLGQEVALDTEANVLTAQFVIGPVSGAGGYSYRDMTNVPDYVVQPGDMLEYDVFGLANADGFQQVFFDILCSDGSSVANQATPNDLDQNETWAKGNDPKWTGRWVHRVFSLGALAGKTIVSYVIAADGGVRLIPPAGGAFGAWFKDIAITNAGAINQRIWMSGDPLPAFAIDANRQYNNSPSDNTFAAYAGVPNHELTLDMSAWNLAVWAPEGERRNIEEERAAAYRLTVIADQPVLWYELGEPPGATAAVDSAASPHNGSYTGASWTSPELGQLGLLPHGADATSATFNGADSQVQSDVAVSGLVAGGSMSLECWARLSGTPPAGVYGGICGFRNNATFQFYMLQLADSTTIEARVGDSGSQVTTITAPGSSYGVPVSPDVVHHLVLTFDAGTGLLTMYVDGEQAGQATYTFSPPTDATLPFQIGAQHALTTIDNWFAGSAQEVALYNTALSP
ncbi:MAG: LamG domain-containing protein, partial [Trebonia sp.]